MKNQSRRNGLTLKNSGLKGKSLLQCPWAWDGPGGQSGPLPPAPGLDLPWLSLTSWLRSACILSNPHSPGSTLPPRTSIWNGSGYDSIRITCALADHFAEILDIFKVPHSQSISVQDWSLWFLNLENNLLRRENILEIRPAFHALLPGRVALESDITSPHQVS